ncbi:MAG: ATP-binding protein [Candidatus Heimdallarchaeota archaeon]|nr:ATP-binding protein [Candidatus Heimdallarchaeota archaeon]
MSTQENNLFQPCSPNDFYGLREILSEFNKVVEQMKKEEGRTHSILVVGDEGTGKSSLLSKLHSTLIGRKDIGHSITLIPEENMILGFFKEWKNAIDELSPDWRSMIEKVGKKKLGDDLPALKETIKKQSSQSYTEVMVKLFFENLDKVDQKLKETQTNLFFFFDNLHLFKLMDVQEFYPIFSSIIKEIVERGYNIVVIPAFNERFLYDFDYEKNLTNNSLILRTESLSVSETEIFLRRKAPALLNKGLLDLVTNSQRSFFDLNLGTGFVETGYGIDDFVERDIPALFKLDEDEEAALLEMSSYNENLFLIEQLTAYVPHEALKSLESKGILWIGTKHARLYQESLLTAMKFRMRLFSPLTTLMVSLDSILDDLDKFIAPTDKMIAQVSELTVKIRDRLADFAIAAKVKRVANMCIQRKMYQRAYDFALINAMQFEQISELEQAGGFCEQIAREFEEKNFYFAAKLYMKSASYYSAVDEELKANRSYARAADQFEKQAMSLPIETSEYAVRGYMKSSLNCYKSMGDATNFEKVRKKAIELYDQDSIHHNYFTNMVYEKEEEKTVLEIEPSKEEETEKVEEISIDNIEKELDF